MAKPTGPAEPPDLAGIVVLVVVNFNVWTAAALAWLRNQMAAPYQHGRIGAAVVALALFRRQWVRLTPITLPRCFARRAVDRVAATGSFVAARAQRLVWLGHDGTVAQILCISPWNLPKPRRPHSAKEPDEALPYDGRQRLGFQQAHGILFAKLIGLLDFFQVRDFGSIVTFSRGKNF